MTFDSARITTITFDSFSTVVDADSAVVALRGLVENAESVSALWRRRSLEYAMVSNFIDAYQTFYEMNRDALRYALDVHDEEVGTEEREGVLSVYHELDVFEDVRDGMERLREGGYPLYVVSNGDPDMLASMIDHANVEDLVEGTISADEVERYKPAPEIYRHAALRTGTPIDEIAHVSNGTFDVMGAMHAGMRGVWLDRKGRPWERFDGEPDLTVGSIHDLADELGV